MSVEAVLSAGRCRHGAAEAEVLVCVECQEAQLSLLSRPRGKVPVRSTEIAGDGHDAGATDRVAGWAGVGAVFDKQAN